MPAIPIGLATVIAGGAGAGAAVYGAHKSAGVGKQQNQIAQANFARSEPAYNAAQQYYMDILNGGSAGLTRALGPDINAMNQSYANARQNLVGNALARGGGLTSRLGQLESGRAMTLSNLVGSSRNNAASALANLANGQQVNALQALAGAQNAQAASAAANSQAWGSIGGFLTRILSNPNFQSQFNTGVQSGSTPGYMPPAIVGQNDGTYSAGLANINRNATITPSKWY